MRLTDYYLMQKLPDQKSKLRFDCTASTGKFPELEALRNKKGSLFMYYGDVPESFGHRGPRRATKALTNQKNISSIFVSDVTKLLAYGDVRGTQDGLLLIFNDDYTQIELFVARGQKKNIVQLYNLLADGELQQEIEELRQRAEAETAIKKEK